MLGAASLKGCTMSPVRPLKTIDLAPRRSPFSEIRCELVRSAHQ
jgi:hypothetical protein